MKLNISLTKEQKTALLSRINSIEEYVQKFLEKRANNIVMQDGY